MHGLGNDFVIIDARTTAVHLTTEQVRHLADRRRGVGCDQLVVLWPSATANVKMQIFNADGGRVSTCGNASRCVAKIIMDEHDTPACVLESDAGLLHAARLPSGIIAVDMGKATITPPAEPIVLGTLNDPLVVHVGNPHLVFFVDDVDADDLATWGALGEHHPLFPERINVEVVQVLSPTHLKMRVWERGAGLTQACGSGACAVAAAAVHKGLCSSSITVTQPGGDLQITLDKDGHVHMAGEAVESFRGGVA